MYMQMCSYVPAAIHVLLQGYLELKLIIHLIHCMGNVYPPTTFTR